MTITRPTYKFEVFEGPLDLLLTLIERHKIDIYDIEISLLLEQYNAWLNEARQLDLTVTADFLEMASRLVYIKSCALLPRSEEEEDPKLALEQLLQEYTKYKRIAAVMRERFEGDRIVLREFIPKDLPPVTPEYHYTPASLLKTYNRVMRRHLIRNTNPGKAFTEIVQKKIIDVGTKIVSVLRFLAHKGKTTFRELFRQSKSRSEVVATFLALLELMHAGRIRVGNGQENPDIQLIRSKKEDRNHGNNGSD